MASKDLQTTNFELSIPTQEQIDQLHNLSWTEQLSRFDLENVRVAGTKVMREPLVGVIVHVQRTRAFYGQPAMDPTTGELRWNLNHNAAEGTSPDCSSEDGLIGRGTPGGACLDCPLSAFGSNDETGATACREFRILYVHTGGPKLMPTVFPVPPTGLKAFRAYFRDLLPLDLSQVVTEIDLEPGQNRAGTSFNRPTFRKVAEVSQDMRAAARAYADAIGNVLA